MGFDLTSTHVLDQVDTTKPYLTHHSLWREKAKQKNDDNWKIDLIIPMVWFRYKRVDEEFVVTVENIWMQRPLRYIVF
jgi:hypothetical protein